MCNMLCVPNLCNKSLYFLFIKLKEVIILIIHVQYIIRKFHKMMTRNMFLKLQLLHVNIYIKL